MIYLHIVFQGDFTVNPIKNLPRPVVLFPDALSPVSAGVHRRENWFDGHAAVVFSGENEVESLSATVNGLPGKYLRIEAEIAASGPEPDILDVYRLRLSQPGKSDETPVTVPILSEVKKIRTVVLEAFYEVNPDLPLELRLDRENVDPRNTCRTETGVLSVSIMSVLPPDGNQSVQTGDGYNSWPFIQDLNGKLVCSYSRGLAHDIFETVRGVYARTSMDGGRKWTEETLISNAPDGGEVAIGKGLDADGAMLLWVRCAGPNWHHDLYRSLDGIRFQRIAMLKPDPMPMQITDIFTVPGTGLMSLWFSGSYDKNRHDCSWGTLVSEDNGKTWKQNVVESGLGYYEWPTEQSAVYLGEGRIIAIARTEGSAPDSSRAQFQLKSEDSGKTWTRVRTNITDVLASTPALLLDRGRLFLYYYQRGTGQLRCRTVDPDYIWNHPLCWSDPAVVALGSRKWHHAGNVNAALCRAGHCLTFYSGDEKNTEVLVKTITPSYL